MSSTWETLRTAMADARTAEELMSDGALRAELARDPERVLRRFRLPHLDRTTTRRSWIVLRRAASAA